uniref:Uncharacterized protein n=1 Tax=Oryza punctata TaxID=4537 RepID=A0A0E0MF12_ORYPU
MEGRRIPAFGQWNHRYGAVLVDDDYRSLMSEQFDCALRASVPAPYVPIKRERASTRYHRRILVFGEWNTADSCSGGSNTDWPAAITPCFDMVNPWIPHCNAKVTMGSDGAVVGKVCLQGERMGSVANIKSLAASKPYYNIAVVQAIDDDDDLYKIPPDLLHHKPMEGEKIEIEFSGSVAEFTAPPIPSLEQEAKPCYDAMFEG